MDIRHSIKKNIIKTVILLVAIAAVCIALTGVSFADAAADNGIPVVYVTVSGSKADIAAMHNDPDHKITCSGVVSIDVPEGFRYADMPANAQCADVAERAMTIRGRGNSTWRANKKPYKLKLNEAADLFGLGSNKHWVLLANAYDRTLIKDRITGWLGDAIGMEYTPRGYPVDLVMRSSDGTYDKYLGSYYLSEQVRVGENRIEIEELKKKDVDDDIITGGYLIQNGMQTEETSPSYFETNSEATWANHTPNFDPSDDGYVNDKQKNYIRGYMQDLEDAIFSADYEGVNSTSYRDLMDLESAAKYWLVDQACKNADSYGTGSTYLYKPRGDKMYWGPLWDFDFAWYYHQNYDRFEINHEWLEGMLYDRGEGGFVQEIKKQWPAVKNALIRIAADDGIIDQYFEETKQSQAADLELYPAKVDSEDTEYTDEEEVFEPEKEKELFKKWILNRVDWIDKHLNDLDNLYHLVSVEVDGTVFDHVFVHHGYPYYYKLTAPPKEGYVLIGWQDQSGKTLNDLVVCNRDVVVRPVYIPEEDATKPTGIIFRNSEVYVDLSENTYQFEFTLIPEDAQDLRVNWVSSNEEIAAIKDVSDGVAEAALYKTGDVTFTATLKSGVSESVTLHIVDYKRPWANSIKTDQDIYTLAAGGYGHIEAIPNPIDGILQDPWLESEDESIVEVDSNGVLKAVKPGRTTVTISADVMRDGSLIQLKKTVEIIVTGSQPDSSKEAKNNKNKKKSAPKTATSINTGTAKKSAAEKKPDVLAAKAIAGKTGAKISWNGVKGAQRYVIYLSKCDKKKTIKKAKIVSGKARTWTKKKLKKKTFYKFKVVAQKKVNGKYKTIRTSRPGHFITGKVKGKYTNPKSLLVNKRNVTLKVGMSTKLKCKVRKVRKGKRLLNHAAKLRYTSNDPSVAKVSKKGKITAKKAGTCKVYVQTCNGIWKTVKVTVR